MHNSLLNRTRTRARKHSIPATHREPSRSTRTLNTASREPSRIIRTLSTAFTTDYFHRMKALFVMQMGFPAAESQSTPHLSRHTRCRYAGCTLVCGCVALVAPGCTFTSAGQDAARHAQQTLRAPAPTPSINPRTSRALLHPPTSGVLLEPLAA
jgi:hypothetical protein